MVLIGILCIGIALLLALISWRGRIVERGSFCRKCKFDLQGLETEHHSKCPECGNLIHQQTSRRTTLRRKSKPGMITALVLLLASFAAIGIGIWGNPGKIYANLPDPLVIQGVKWGSSTALDEASSRLVLSPSFAKQYHNDLLNYALAVQADRTRPWDPRLGQILLDALINGQLNKEQIESYAINGWTHKLDLRDKVHAGEKFIQYRLYSAGDRVGATGYAVTNYRYGARLKEYGVLGDQPVWKAEHRDRIGSRMFITGTGGSKSWTGSSLWKMDTYTSKTQVGDSIPVYIDLETRLEDPNSDEPIVSNVVRLERSVLVVSPDEPIVRKIKNPEYTEQIAEAITLGQIHTMERPTPPGPNHYNIIMKFSANIDALPASFSFKVYFRIGDEEVHIGELVREGPATEPHGQYVEWGVYPGDSAGLESALALHAIALEQGKIDVILRTDPDTALAIPTINEVIETTIEFSGMPIKIVETPQEVNNPDWDGVHVVGKAIEDE